MRIVFALVAVGLIIAILCDAALSWDGAYYLFTTLDTQTPFVVHDRLIDAPLHWPVLLANRLTDNLAVLRFVFGLVHVVTPLAALAASWWIVRQDRPGLIVWPMFGIGLGTLAGQMNFISEGIKTHQLFWPVLLAILIGLPGRAIPLVSIIALVIMFLHPAAAPLFVAGALTAVLVGVLRPDTRSRLFPLAWCMAIAALLRFGMIRPGYEGGEMNADTLLRQWENAGQGPPLVALAGTAVAAVATIAAPRLPRAARFLPLAGVAVAGVALLPWANDTAQWRDALEFRGPSLFVSLTVMGLAVLDALVNHSYLAAQAGRPHTPRLRTAQAAALVFALVIATQSTAWRAEVDDMRGAMAASETSCVPMTSLTKLDESPLNLWSTTSLSLLYQGWTPDRIVLAADKCEIARESGVLPVVPWIEDHQEGRFDLLPMRWTMAADGGCWMRLTSGWHEPEQSGDTWWRWSPHAGEVRVVVGQEGTAMMTGMISSVPQPNRVSILVNGESQHVIDLRNDEWQPMDGMALDLKVGENFIRFVSEQPAGHAPPDERDLALSIMNLNLTVPSLRTQCTLH